MSAGSIRRPSIPSVFGRLPASSAPRVEASLGSGCDPDRFDMINSSNLFPGRRFNSGALPPNSDSFRACRVSQIIPDCAVNVDRVFEFTLAGRK